MIQRVTSRNLAILSSLLYSLAFPFKKLHALIHLTDPFCQASDGGLHFGSESGVGAELEKNSAPIASALITCRKLPATDHIMGPSNRDKGPLSHLPQNVKMRVLPHSKEKNESYAMKLCKHYLQSTVYKMTSRVTTFALGLLLIYIVEKGSTWDFVEHASLLFDTHAPSWRSALRGLNMESEHLGCTKIQNKMNQNTIFKHWPFWDVSADSTRFLPLNCKTFSLEAHLSEFQPVVRSWEQQSQPVKKAAFQKAGRCSSAGLDSCRFVSWTAWIAQQEIPTQCEHSFHRANLQVYAGILDQLMAWMLQIFINHVDTAATPVPFRCAFPRKALTCAKKIMKREETREKRKGERETTWGSRRYWDWKIKSARRNGSK